MSDLPGAFIISLDFELHWGVFDHTPLTEKSRAYFDRTRALIDPTLQQFAEHDVRATWATVGMLFARDKAELTRSLPSKRPEYRDPALSPYRLLDEVGSDEASDPYHYALSLIERVAATPGQVVGSHTFGHYYCLEAGQNLASFTADLAAAQRLSQQRLNTRSTSLVFPRNQYRRDYFPALQDHGFTTYRGNPDLWFWRSRSGEDTTLLQRAVRLSDNYLNFGANTLFSHPTIEGDSPMNIPASRFFRPYVARIDGYGGQRLKVRRILREMSTAARNQAHYHLWWHPHNLATHPEKNMAALKEILQQYQTLNHRYGWQSHSMETFASQQQITV